MKLKSSFKFEILLNFEHFVINRKDGIIREFHFSDVYDDGGIMTNLSDPVSLLTLKKNFSTLQIRTYIVKLGSRVLDNVGYPHIECN
jgi:hypothetical protein